MMEILTHVAAVSDVSLDMRHIHVLITIHHCLCLNEYKHILNNNNNNSNVNKNNSIQISTVHHQISYEPISVILNDRCVFQRVHILGVIVHIDSVGNDFLHMLIDDSTGIVDIVFDATLSIQCQHSNRVFEIGDSIDILGSISMKFIDNVYITRGIIVTAFCMKHDPMGEVERWLEQVHLYSTCYLNKNYINNENLKSLSYNILRNGNTTDTDDNDINRSFSLNSSFDDCAFLEAANVVEEDILRSRALHSSTLEHENILCDDSVDDSLLAAINVMEQDVLEKKKMTS